MAINFFNNLQVNKGYIEIDDGGTTNQRGIISYGVNGKIGATTGWTPDIGSQPGLWVEGSNDGESGGIFMNGNTCALWSPGDQGILKIYDEDNFSQGPVYQITGSGISEGNRFASIFDNTYYLDPDGDSQLNTVDVDDYVRHRGDTNTYIGFPADDTFTITTFSSERMRIDSSGRVGIGTATPATKLDVSGDIRLEQYGLLEWGGNTSNRLAIRNGLSGATFTLQGSGNIELNPTSGGITFKASGTTSAVLTSSGDFGIGTTNPQKALQVSTTGSTDYQFRLGTDAYYYDIGRNTSNGFLNFYGNQSNASGFVFETTNGERMRIDHDGNVGIGTDNPGGLLHVSSGTSGDAVVIIESDTDNSDENDNPHVELRQDGGGIKAKLGIEGNAGSTYSNSLANATYLGTVFEQPLQFITGNTGGVQTAKMTIEPNSGNVGIRTVSPASALDVNGTIRVRNQLNVGETSEQNLFVQGGTGAQYVKMGAYGGANFQGLQSSENIPRTTTAFGANGKIVEATRIYTTKIQGSGFPTTNGFTGGVDITPTPGSASIIYIRNILVHRPPNSTQGANWGSSQSPIYFAIKGTSNEIIASQVIARIPRNIVVSGTQNVYTYMPPIIGTLNSSDQYSSNLEEHTAPGSALKMCLSVDNPASFTPPSTLFVSVEYSMINLTNFRNNPDQTLS